jgi:diaminohydroxyphosphoribosylaminopyrimidine deaminase / 5-amino-6-(5-phosphoribosylamino)uracil reductase
MNDSEAMFQALTCARSVEGRTSPRPPVGAVVVKDGAIVGRGATSPPYGPHAEVHALREAGELSRGADLYVTLEPCCITVHTPPCTNAIIAAGIRRVIVGSVDSNPLVSGRGFEQLRAAGIEVVVGVAAQETDELLRPFATYITQGRPYVTAKWAMTLDGKLATRTRDAYWISNDASRIWVHNLRDRVDAIMIGAETARVDNPQLTVRLTEEQRFYQRTDRPDPWRVIVSTRGELPTQLQLLQGNAAARTIVMVGEACESTQRQRLQERGVDVIPITVNQRGQIDLDMAFRTLAQKGIMHVLLEGGNQLLGSAFDQALIDHVVAFIAPKLAGGMQAPSPIGGYGIALMKDATLLDNIRTQIIDGDVLIEGDIHQKHDFVGNKCSAE